MFKVPYVDHPKQYASLKPEIDQAVEKVLLSGRYVLGLEVANFEKAMEAYLGIKNVIGLNSGTDALILALKAAGIGKGDEVITVAWTFVATLAAIRHVGAKAILIDVDKDFNMDPNLVEKALSQKTKAIIPVHLNGRVCSGMDNLETFCRINNVVLVEDACQSLGATYKRRKAGTFGTAGCFSLHPLKVLSACGDGGFLTTSSDIIARKVRLLRDHGQETKESIKRYGYNSRLDEVQAVIVVVKLKYLDKWIQRRRGIAQLYHTSLSNLPNLVLPPLCVDDVYASYVIRVERGRDLLKKYLAEKSIETMINWPTPLHLQTNLRLDPYLLPNTELFSKQVLSLPISAEITNEQVEYVCKIIKEWCSKNG